MPPRDSYRPWSPEHERLAVDAARRGVPCAEIGAQIGRGAQSVARMRERFG